MPSSGRSRLVPGGGAAVVAAAALWGTTGTAAHFAPAGATPVGIGAARIVVGGGLLLLVGLLSADGGGRAPARRGAELRGLLAAAGGRRACLAAGALAVAGYQLCFFAAVRMTGIAIGTLVAIGSGPVWAGLISVLTRGLAVLAELSVLATLAAYLLYGRGLRTVPAPAAVTLGLAEPVVATVLAVIIAGERLHGAAPAGLALIGCALAVLAAPRRGAGELRENHRHG